MVEQIPTHGVLVLLDIDIVYNTFFLKKFMLDNYYKSAKERADIGIPPLPLDAEQTSQLVELIKNVKARDEELLNLLTERVPAGVDDAAYIKAAFLADVAKEK